MPRGARTKRECNHFLKEDYMSRMQIKSTKFNTKSLNDFYVYIVYVLIGLGSSCVLTSSHVFDVD